MDKMLSPKDQFKRFFRRSTSSSMPKFESVEKPIELDYEDMGGFDKRSSNSTYADRTRSYSPKHKYAKSHPPPKFLSGIANHISTTDLFVEQQPITDLPPSPLRQVTNFDDYENDQSDNGLEDDNSDPHLNDFLTSNHAVEETPLPTRYKENLSPVAIPSRRQSQRHSKPLPELGDNHFQHARPGDKDKDYESDEDLEPFTPIGDLKHSLLPPLSPMPSLTIDCDFSHYRLSTISLVNSKDDYDESSKGYLKLPQSNKKSEEIVYFMKDAQLNNKPTGGDDYKSIQEESNENDTLLQNNYISPKTPRKHQPREVPVHSDRIDKYYEWDNINANINLIQQSINQWDQNQLSDEIEQMLVVSGNK